MIDDRPAEVGMPLAGVDTPALLVDLDGPVVVLRVAAPPALAAVIDASVFYIEDGVEVRLPRSEPDDVSSLGAELRRPGGRRWVTDSGSNELFRAK